MLIGMLTDIFLFCSIECNEHANYLMRILNQHIQAGYGKEQWHCYFRSKMQEQHNMGRDNLNFVGNQLNVLYSDFEECEDKQVLDL